MLWVALGDLVNWLGVRGQMGLGCVAFVVGLGQVDFLDVDLVGGSFTLDGRLDYDSSRAFRDGERRLN